LQGSSACMILVIIRYKCINKLYADVEGGVWSPQEDQILETALAQTDSNHNWIAQIHALLPSKTMDEIQRRSDLLMADIKVHSIAHFVFTY